MRGLPPSNDFCQSLSHLLQLCLQSFKQPFALLLLCVTLDRGILGVGGLPEGRSQTRSCRTELPGPDNMVYVGYGPLNEDILKYKRKILKF